VRWGRARRLGHPWVGEQRVLCDEEDLPAEEMVLGTEENPFGEVGKVRGEARVLAG
jgi:hypothetical protein